MYGVILHTLAPTCPTEHSQRHGCSAFLSIINLAMNPCPAFHFLISISAGSAWIAVSIAISVAKTRKEGVAIPKSIQVPISIEASITNQASVPIQVPKASVAVWVLVPVVPILAPKSVAIQAPKTIEVLIAEWRIAPIIIEVPVESHRSLVQVNLKHTPRSQVSFWAAHRSRKGSKLGWS